MFLWLLYPNDFVFAGEEVKSGEKKEEAQAPASEETKTEEQTTAKSDK